MSMRTHHRTPDCGCGLPGETLVFWRPSRCPFPKHTFDPPFNVVGSSHIALGVAEPGRSRAFFCDARLPAARTATATPSPGAAARRGGIRVPMGGTDRAASGLRSRLRGASRQQSCQILPRYCKARRVAPRVRRARPSCAHPARVSAGNRCGASRCRGRAAPGVVCGQGGCCRTGPHGDQDAFGMYPTCWCGTATPH